MPSQSAQLSENTLEHVGAIGREIAPPLATALAYALAAMAGGGFAFPSAPVSALWAPNAILLAALLLARRERWWIYLLAVLPFHLLVQLPDIPFVRAAIQYGANMAEAVIGAYALLLLGTQPPRFDRLKPIVTLVLVGGVVAPLGTSLFMVGAFALAGIPADFWLTIAVRTVTNTFAIVTLVPLIVLAAGTVKGGHRHVPLFRVVEFVALVAGISAVSAYAFAVPAPAAPHSIAWAFAPLPFLVWATIRFRVPGACSAVLLVGVISAFGVLKGNGPFNVENPIENALSLVAFQLVLCVTFVLCAALLEEWRRATRELEANQARLRLLVEHNQSAEAGRLRAEGLHAAVLGSVHDEIAVLDGAGTIIEANGSWRRAVQLAHPARFDRVVETESYLAACARAADDGNRNAGEQLEALRSVLAGRETRRHFEYVEPAGMEPAWIEVSIEKLQRPEGGAIVTRADVSPRKRAEQEARVQQQQLAHLSRAAVLGQLSGAFAHELNQPLTSILGNAEAALKLAERGTDHLPEITEILRDIVNDDVRAAQVIDRLRALLERGDLLRRPVDLNAAVLEVLELAKSELVTRHVRVTMDLQNDVPVLLADRVQIQQIVLNLLMNACEAMGAQPVAHRKLRLASRFLVEESCVLLSMEDQGCGIAAGDLERIFQPFVTTKSHGMGMGLAICRSVAEAHQGRLWAESGGNGAKFYLQLPVGGALA